MALCGCWVIADFNPYVPPVPLAVSTVIPIPSAYSASYWGVVDPVGGELIMGVDVNTSPYHFDVLRWNPSSGSTVVFTGYPPDTTNMYLADGYGYGEYNTNVPISAVNHRIYVLDTNAVNPNNYAIRAFNLTNNTQDVSVAGGGFFENQNILALYVNKADNALWSGWIQSYRAAVKSSNRKQRW
jgi:hypothetical protein